MKRISIKPGLAVFLVIDFLIAAAIVFAVLYKG